MGVSLDELAVADAPDAWSAAGFTVGPDGVCVVGTVRVRLVGRGTEEGIVSWSLREVPDATADIDGVPTVRSTTPVPTPGTHANGVVRIDHVVLMSPDLDRTAAALASLDVHPRRERDGELMGSPIRQIFYRLDDVILEVVGAPGASGEGPAQLWGLTHVVEDIDAAAGFFGDSASPVRDAVQPGRRITTLRHRDLGLSVRTALISPHVRAAR